MEGKMPKIFCKTCGSKVNLAAYYVMHIFFFYFFVEGVVSYVENSYIHEGTAFFYALIFLKFFYYTFKFRYYCPQCNALLCKKGTFVKNMDDK